MKPSLYNHIIRRRGRPQLLHNIRTKNFLELNPVQSAIYGGLAVPITRNLMNQKDPAVEQLLRQLADLGFFLADEVQEPLELEVRSLEHRFDERRLSLWVQATTRCEEECPDCPYRDDPADLGTGAIERLEGLVSARAGLLRELDVTWFGGEPTINWETVSSLNRKFSDTAASRGFRYRWEVISNGRSHHLKTILISPDSPRRAWLNLGSLDSGEYDAHSTVLLTDFTAWEARREKLPLLSRIRFQPGKPSARLCRNLSGLCQRTPRFTDDEYEAMRRLLDSGHRLENLPAPALVPCPAVDARSFIMDVRGNLYKCWNSFGQPQQGVPGVDDRLHPNFIRWMDWSPFRQYHCRNCNILPWCLGGCLDRPRDEDCGQWRYSLREILKLLAPAPPEAGLADLSPEAQS